MAPYSKPNAWAKPPSGINFKFQIPISAESHFKQGLIYHQQGKLTQASNCYEQALKIQPLHFDSIHMQGVIAAQSQRFELAVEWLTRAVSIDARNAIAYSNLGNALQGLGRYKAAIENYDRAIQMNPNFEEAYNNRGESFAAIKQYSKSLESFEKAIQINPKFAEAYNNAGVVLRELGNLDQAIECLRKAVLNKQDYADAYNNLALALVDTGRFDEAIFNYRQAIEFDPDLYSAHSNLVYAMQYVPTYTAEEVFAEHQRYAQRVQSSLPGSTAPHINSRDPGRRLKVGYVSGDFRAHAVAFFIEPILASHDKAQVEVYCYHNSNRHDSHTEKFIALADHWLVCNGMSDEQFASRIRADGIDILVDLSGHTADNRLPMFARKPAPVQMTWIGYAGTTGLAAMDYRITDVYMDPPGLTERFHSETLIRLPGSNITYRPEPGCPDVNELPALTSGKVVFASLNNLTKVNQSVVNLWSRILTALPQSTLMLGNVTEDAIAQRLIAMFGSAGIGPERLQLQPRMTMLDYLKLHHQIDIALDPFPYNGGTTSMHSLWMGVPIVTMAGAHAVSRVGVAVLSRVGLQDFITQNEEEYVQRVLNAAQDLQGLNQMRQSLRERMSVANCDPESITRNLEEAYRSVWRIWCEA
jgi:protein O-GlcNAc transferase